MPRRHGWNIETGWLAIPWGPNWSNIGFGWANGEYCRSGNTLRLRGGNTRQTSNSGATATMATFPIGFRPSGITIVGYEHASGATVVNNTLYVDSSGNFICAASILTGYSALFSGEVPLD